MEQVILNMLDQYSCITDDDYENALKQIMQQIALLGLWRSKFFEHAAFYGGTALRILYQLNRFSEDLDFSLLEENPEFDLQPYLNAIQSELLAFGFETEVSLKNKTVETAIQSAFLKSNTQQHLIRIQAPTAIQEAMHGRKTLKIKLEVDVLPPPGFKTEVKPILRPVPFWVKCYTLPDLFAGKLSAVLCRRWKNRVKGRDWYDFLWFIQNNIPVHLSHLELRLRAFDFYEASSALDEVALKNLLVQCVENLDVDLAKQDISRFVSEHSTLDAWTKPLFLSAINELRVER